jgi:hypothetical protein
VSLILRTRPPKNRAALPFIAMGKAFFAAPRGVDACIAAPVTIVNFAGAAKPLGLNISYDRGSIRFTGAGAQLYA